MQQESLFPLKNKNFTARQINILKSSKNMGTSDKDSLPYLKELGINIENRKQPIQFTPNANERVHRWAPYVQGFSASFVENIQNKYRAEYHNPVVFDPFTGCGTVQVQSKLNGLPSAGTELNPLLKFIAETKLNTWDSSPNEILNVYNNLRKDKRTPAPHFIKSEKHFSKDVLQNLEKIKGSLDFITGNTEPKIVNLLKLAFSSILIEVSNLKRSPCLGYTSHKSISPELPYQLFEQKVNHIIRDINEIQKANVESLNTRSEVILANAMDYKPEDKFDLVITSPPYMNGLDYVINYKIEMGWLNFAEDQKQLRSLKDEMVVCDNVSKGLINKFEAEYSNDCIENIKSNIQQNIEKRGNYRRPDMPNIVHKYFDDIYRVFNKIVNNINNGGRFILVVGDSLIADVYVPTDLLIAKIGKDLGLEIEKIEKARSRRSGQIRSYKLRETIITLRKT